VQGRPGPAGRGASDGREAIDPGGAAVIESIGTPLMWGVFAVIVVTALALDLFVFHRKAHSPSFRESAMWVVVWVALALGFNLWIYLQYGSKPALEFLAGYLVEEALSVDNIFVFIVIFRYFGTPSEYRHRVLFWGILGAVVMRGLFVVAGVALISRFHWIIYIFGAFLLYTGIKLLTHSEVEIDPEKNPVIGFLRRHLRIVPRHEGQTFLVREADGKLWATPLLVVLLVIEATDVVFAVDSIPAIFGITKDPFIIFTSNIFAVLGLRAMYFVLHGLMDRFEYLHYGLGLVLAFVGLKMLLEKWVHVPIQVSLGVIVVLLGGAVLISWISEKRRGPADPQGP
jgi:tellurite resistance protein TerC